MGNKARCKNCDKFKRLCECGRPETITLEKETKLEEGLQLGMPIVKALFYAGVTHASYYRKFAKDIPFRYKMTVAQYHMSVLARKSLLIGITKNPSLALAYLERKEPDEFSMKQIRAHEGSVSFNFSGEAKKRLAKYQQNPSNPHEEETHV
jgi:hypothetical protein